MKPRVLITRDPLRAASLVNALQECGFEASVVPVTRTIFLTGDKALPDIRAFSWIAFSSANAVEAFALAMDDADARLAETNRLAAVGPATAAAARERFRYPDLVEPKATGVELALSLLEMERGRTDWSVLWPCASQPLQDFPATLGHAGVKVVPWECYTTEAVPVSTLQPQLKAAKPWHAAVFAAPSAVAAFAEAWDEEWDFPAIAIGTTTGKALQSQGASCVIVSQGTESQDLLNAVISAIGKSEMLPESAGHNR